MKPAADYDIRCGHHLIEAQSATWPRMIAVSSPTAYKVAAPHLSQEPAGVAFTTGLDFGYLEGLADGLPNDADLVLGIGGGQALDAGKFVALKKQLPLVLIPTVVSTGSIIHGVVARWKGRNLADKAQWPRIDPEHVLIDYDVVLSAPEHLNTAGIGDVLCGYASVAEWKRHTRLGNGEPYDAAMASAMLQHHRDIVDGFPQTLDGDGGLTPQSVRFIMTAVKDRDTTRLISPMAPTSDHSFLQALELVNDKSWVHGELAALGAVIVTWHCEPPAVEALIERLQTCHVRWRPQDMGVSRDELSRGLAFCPQYFGDTSWGRDVPSGLRSDPITGDAFDRLWTFLQYA